MAANDNSLNKLSKSQLIEIVRSLQQRERNVVAQRDDFAHQLSARQIRIANAGSIAEASLALSGIFESAQYAADEYVASVRTMIDEVYQASAQSAEAANARAAQAMQQSQIDANNLLSEANSEAERVRSEANSEAERVLEEAQREALRLIGVAEAEAKEVISEANAMASKIVAEAQASAKVTFDHAESILAQAKSLAAEQARASIPPLHPYPPQSASNPYGALDAQDVESVVSSASVTAEIPLISVDGASRVMPVEFEPRETLLQKVTRAAAASKPKRSGAHAQQSIVSRALDTIELIKQRKGAPDASVEADAPADVRTQGDASGRMAPADAPSPEASPRETAARQADLREDRVVRPTSAAASAVSSSGSDDDELELEGAFAGSRWFVDDDLDDGLLEEGALDVPSASSASVRVAGADLDTGEEEASASRHADAARGKASKAEVASALRDASGPQRGDDAPAVGGDGQTKPAAASALRDAAAVGEAGRSGDGPNEPNGADDADDASGAESLRGVDGADTSRSVDGARGAEEAAHGKDAESAPADGARDDERPRAGDAPEASGAPQESVEGEGARAAADAAADPDAQGERDDSPASSAGDSDAPDPSAADDPDADDLDVPAADEADAADEPRTNKIDASSWIFIDSGISVE